MSDNFDKLLNNKNESAPKKKPKRNPFRRALVTLVIVLLVAALLVCGAGVWGYKVSVDKHILPNTYVGRVLVGGMTREEASDALRASGFDAHAGESLAVSLPAGAGFWVDYLRSGAVLSREAAVDLAYAPGHGTNVFANLWAAVKSRLAPTTIEMEQMPLDEAYRKPLGRGEEPPCPHDHRDGANASGRGVYPLLHGRGHPGAEHEPQPPRLRRRSGKRAPHALQGRGRRGAGHRRAVQGHRNGPAFGRAGDPL